MATNIVTSPPEEWFTPPGVVRISSSALELARAFRTQAIQTQPEADWVISFDWSDSRRIREKGANIWRDVGAGLDLTAYETHQVPSGVVQLVDDLSVAIKIPSQIWEASAERLIDTDERAFSGLVLR